METIQLGRHRLPVVPQKHARLRRQLSPEDFRALMSRDYGREAYRVLSILIPALSEQMPEWEWEGFASEEAMKDDEYREELDNSPTFAEIVEAFETVLRVNGAGVLGKLMDLVKLGQIMQKEASSALQAESTPSLPDSPGENGGSPSTTTGTSQPTPTESAG